MKKVSKKHRAFMTGLLCILGRINGLLLWFVVLLFCLFCFVLFCFVSDDFFFLPIVLNNHITQHHHNNQSTKQTKNHNNNTNNSSFSSQLVYIHEDRNKDNYHVFDFGAEKLEQNKENENQNKDPLLEKGIDWAEQQENVAFMEWGGGKKADRRYLERMRRAIMLDEAFYEKGITIKRAR